MPIYEYQCERCEAVTDIKHGFKETITQVCPACEGQLKRVFRPAGIVFKGSGFYVTDSRASSASAKSDGSKTDGKSDGSKTDGKGDGSKTDDKSGSTEKSEKPATEVKAEKPKTDKSDAAA